MKREIYSSYSIVIGLYVGVVPLRYCIQSNHLSKTSGRLTPKTILKPNEEEAKGRATEPSCGDDIESITADVARYRLRRRDGQGTGSAVVVGTVYTAHPGLSGLLITTRVVRDTKGDEQTSKRCYTNKILRSLINRDDLQVTVDTKKVLSLLQRVATSP